MATLQPTERRPGKRIPLLLGVSYLILLLAGCGPTRTMPMEAATHPETYSVFKEYRLVSGDVLDINYFFDLSTEEYRIAAGDRLLIHFPGASSARSEQVVRRDGAITLLSAGDIIVAGKTPAEASALIRGKVEHPLRFPEATVQVLQSRSALEDAVITAGRGSSKQYEVRPDGMLTLPAVGSLMARGKSIETLTAEINSLYREQWPSARVDINLLESQGLQVYVLGEVGRPGNYKISGPAVLPQALSMAGGLTREAAGGVVYIARLENEVYQVSRLKLNNNYTDSNTNTLPLVAPNDIIFVPRSTLSEVAQIMQEISNILLFRGWGVTFNYNLKDDSEDYNIGLSL